MDAVLVDGMPQSGRKSEISPLCNGKGSVFECENYRGIKLMAHIHELPMKLWERIIDQRIRQIVGLHDITFSLDL